MLSIHEPSIVHDAPDAPPTPSQEEEAEVEEDDEELARFVEEEPVSIAEYLAERLADVEATA